MVFSSVPVVHTFEPFEKKLNVCLVGLGRAGTFHMQSLMRLTDRAKLTWVVDVNEDAVKKAVAVFGCKSSANLDDALADPELDAVIVASTTHCHYDHVTRSLRANKAVFTEKPLSHDNKELVQVVDLVRQSKLPFMVGFQRRYDTQFRDLKAQMEAGHLGEPRVIRSTSRDNPEPSLAYLKISGGIFHDMLVHDFDMLFFLTGEVPESVYSVGHCYNSEIAKFDDLDTVLVTFKYSSGLVASVDTSRISPYGYDQRIEVFGSKGLGAVRNVETSNITIATQSGFQTPPAHYSFPQRYPEAYLSELRDFVGLALSKQTLPDRDIQWLVELEKVTTAAEFSWRLNRPVRIDEVDALVEQHKQKHQ